MHINRKIYLIKAYFIYCWKLFYSAIVLIHSAIISMQSMQVFFFVFFCCNNDGKKLSTKNIVDYIGKHDVNWKVLFVWKKRGKREKYRKKTWIFVCEKYSGKYAVADPKNCVCKIHRKKAILRRIAISSALCSNFQFTSHI